MQWYAMDSDEDSEQQAPILEIGDSDEQPDIPEVLPILPLKNTVVYPIPILLPLIVGQPRSIKLVDEALVSVSGTSTPIAAPTISDSDPHGPYSAPKLNSYSDMADLLALDPPMPGLAETTFIPPEEV